MGYIGEGVVVVDVVFVVVERALRVGGGDGGDGGVLLFVVLCVYLCVYCLLLCVCCGIGVGGGLCLRCVLIGGLRVVFLIVEFLIVEFLIVSSDFVKYCC